MNWSRIIFKTHKWLAVAVFLPALLWFFSGVVILVPGKWFGALTVMNPGPPAGPGYEEIAVSVSQAIAAVKTESGENAKVAGIDFARIDGRLLYRIRIRGEAMPHFVDALTGERYVFDAEKARALLTKVVPGPFQPETPLLHQHDSSYTYGPLPAYRLDAGDTWKTTYFVAVENGEIRRTTLSGRVFQFLDGMHTFSFLVPSMGRPAVRVVMLFFGVLGTVMSVFGVAILWLQFVNWRERRQRV